MIQPQIYTGQPEDVAEEFKDEVKGFLEDAAIKLGCNVEELKYRVNNVGIVEVERMDGHEIAQMEADRIHKKNIDIIKKRKGLI